MFITKKRFALEIEVAVENALREEREKMDIYKAIKDVEQRNDDSLRYVHEDIRDLYQKFNKLEKEVFKEEKETPSCEVSTNNGGKIN